MLGVELTVAERMEDYDQCAQLQVELQGLAMTVTAAAALPHPIDMYSSSSSTSATMAAPPTDYRPAARAAQQGQGPSQYGVQQGPSQYAVPGGPNQYNRRQSPPIPPPQPQQQQQQQQQQGWGAPQPQRVQRLGSAGYGAPPPPPPSQQQQQQQQVGPPRGSTDRMTESVKSAWFTAPGSIFAYPKPTSTGVGEFSFDGTSSIGGGQTAMAASIAGEQTTKVSGWVLF